MNVMERMINSNRLEDLILADHVGPVAAQTAPELIGLIGRGLPMNSSTRPRSGSLTSVVLFKTCDTVPNQTSVTRAICSC